LRLRELRRGKNLSQKELGEIVDIHHTHIWRYEKGTSRPSSGTLKRLADALGATTDYLIGGNTEAVAQAKLEDQELLNHFQELEKLPEDDKSVVKKLLEAFITRRKLQTLLVAK